MLQESWSGHQYESCSEETKVNYTALLDYRPCVSLQVPSTTFVCRLDNLYNLCTVIQNVKNMEDSRNYKALQMQKKINAVMKRIRQTI